VSGAAVRTSPARAAASGSADARAAVLGAGSWGTALAIHLARSGVDTVLWARRSECAADLERERLNAAYLPGCRFPDALRCSGDLAAALAGRNLVLFVAPAQRSRAIFRGAAAHLPPDADCVIASKGIEETTGLRLDEVLAQESPGPARDCVILSGPSFAQEVGEGQPTAVVVASADDETARRVQERIASGPLRLYRNRDPIGVALAGALKNVMAVATGIAEGTGLGLNTRAALLTRGLAEMTRLGVAAGGSAATFAGLAGLGDLVLTCTGGLSRNRSLGIEIGRGRRLEEILAERRTVAEGVATTRAALALAARHGVDLPIASQVRDVLEGRRSPAEAVRDLLARQLREE
jgi:glycerol-3-phosphate dehydrogenase (NAD(P)+)